MPIRVPTPANQGAANLGAVQLAADPRTPLQNFSAPDLTGPGRALQEGGRSFQKGASSLLESAIIKDKQDGERQLLEVQKEFGIWRRDQLYSEDGLFNKKAGDVVGASKSMEERYTEWQSQTTNGRSLSDNNRVAMEEWLEAKKTALLDTTSKYEYEQVNDYNNQNQEAHIENLIDEATFDVLDVRAFRAGASGIAQAAQDIAVRQGYKPGDDYTKEFIETKLSGLYTAAITRALAKDRPGLAANYLAEADAKKILTGETLAKYEAAVKQSSVDDEARTLINGLMPKYKDNERGALEYLRTAEMDPSVRKAAISEMKVRFAEEDKFEKDRIKSLKVDAVALAREGRFNEIDAVALVDMGDAMSATLRLISERKLRGYGMVAKPAVINKLNQMSDVEFEGTDLNVPEYLEGLDEAKWQYFSDIQGRLNRASTSANEREFLRSRATVISDTTKRHNLSTGQSATLSIVLDQRLAAMPVEERNKADLQAIADTLIVKGEVRTGRWYENDANMRLMEVPEADRAKFRVDYSDIPQATRKAIEDRLKTTGETVTDTAVEDMYSLGLLKQGGY